MTQMICSEIDFITEQQFLQHILLQHIFVNCNDNRLFVVYTEFIFSSIVREAISL
jgi:hypothetical protein